MNRFKTTVLAALVALAACGGASDAEPVAEAETTTPPSNTAMAVAAGELPSVLVFKSPTCGCCNGWVEHMEGAGYEVDARDTRDVMSVKIDAGVPPQMSSCHTSVIDGYVVEGHVPADVIQRLLAERPDIKGIAVPGMPIGSPGMEGSNAEPYQVFSFDAEGNTAVFAEVDPR